MKKIIRSSSVNIRGVDIELSYKNKRSLGYYWIILDRIVRELLALLKIHCKVYCLRLDFHTSRDDSLNSDFSRFMKGFVKALKNKYETKNIGYVWVREQNNNQVDHHYHLILYIDGNKVRKPQEVYELSLRLWLARGHDHVQRCWGKIIKRGYIEQLSDLAKAASYVAKVYSKKRYCLTANDYSSSRLAI